MISNKKIEDLSSLIVSVGKSVSDRIRSETKKEKNILTPVCLGALKFISEKVSPTMKEFADHFGITPPSATATIEILAKERYLNRDFDNNDRRIVRLSITDKGLEILRKSLSAARKKMEGILSKMDENEIDNLYSGLKHFSEVIKKK